MTKIYSIVILVLFASTSYAQSFGNEVSLSLSQGAYYEVQDEGSIIQIGLALYDVNTREIIEKFGTVPNLKNGQIVRTLVKET